MLKKTKARTSSLLLSLSAYFAKRPYKFLLFLVAILCLGCLLGVVYQGVVYRPTDQRYPLASQSEISEAKKQITDQFLAENSTECSDPTDPISPKDRVEVFHRYLKVNKYDNRAVVRGCNDIDQMLARNSAGEWYATGVNVSLDTRANPYWQVECLIDDITTADDIIRPENSSIDSYNYLECQAMNEHEFTRRLLTEGYKEFNQTPNEGDIQEYIRAIRNPDL
jgi:hypothetical protein